MKEPSAEDTLARDPAGVTIAVTGGGTAGHTHVSLAVAQELRDRDSASVLYLGRDSGLEKHFATQAGFRCEPFRALPFERQGFVGKAKALAALPRAILRCRSILAENEVGALFASGGFVSVAPVLAARSLGLPTVLHEANAGPGLANRLLSRVATYVLHAWAPEDSDSDRPVVEHGIGTPLKPEIEELQSGPGGAMRMGSTSPHSAQSPHGDGSKVLVMAGSEGSSFLNRHLPQLLAELASERRLSIRHFTGEGVLSATREAYADAGLEAAHVRAFDDRISEHYQWADLIVTGAGGVTLAELCHLGLPCFLVPVSGLAADHQRRNLSAVLQGCPVGVRFWAQEQGLVEGEQQRLDCRETLAALLDDEELRRQLSGHLRSLARPGARARVADLLATLAQSRDPTTETRRRRAPVPITPSPSS